MKTPPTENQKALLVLTVDATWYIMRSLSQADGPRDVDIQETWHGWEEFLQTHTHEKLKTIHNLAFPGIKIPKALTAKEALCMFIWNYRLSKAIDVRFPQVKENAVKNPLQRASAISGRRYVLTTPDADAKPFTSPAGLACLALIKECCGDSIVCTEGDLKALVLQKGETITPTAKEDPSSAWRFLQFYRPKLVEAQLITYHKV